MDKSFFSEISAFLIETGEPREVHHFCVMTGYGADAVNPYMAFVVIDRLIREKHLSADKPERTIIDEMNLAQDNRSNIRGDFGVHTTRVNKVFATGDCRRGQSLVVWAIREGREAKREIDRFLMGSSSLP